MYRNCNMIVAILAATVFAAGCAQNTVRSEDFLSNYANLQKVNDDFSFYKAPGMNTQKYPRMILDPVKFDLTVKNASDFSEEEKAEVREYAQKAAHKVLSTYFQMVTQPGPGTGRVRIAFTDIEKSNALLALYPVTRATGTGRGGAAIEGEVIDSVTGSQLVAFTRKGKGSLAHGSGVGALSDIKTAVDTWTENAIKSTGQRLQK